MDSRLLAPLAVTVAFWFFAVTAFMLDQILRILTAWANWSTNAFVELVVDGGTTGLFLAALGMTLMLLRSWARVRFG